MSTLNSQVRFDFSKVAINAAKELHMMVSLEAPVVESDQERAPLNISAVIDESGSMSGQNKMDLVKASLHKMLEHLTERDRIGLVGFTTDVREIIAPALMSPDNKQKFAQAVDALAPQMSTNLSGGLLRGFEQMKGASEDALNRVIVFTDGLANVGVTEIEALTSMLSTSAKQHPVKNITVSCFGYGNDVDGSFLEAIAKAGRGNYYYIDKPDNAPGAFGKELGGLLSTVAQNIRVEITPKEDVEILEVLNDFTVVPDGDKTIVELDDILSEEKRHVVVHLKVPAISNAVAARPFKVCDVNVVYDSIVDAQRLTDELKAKIEAVKNGQVQDKPDPDVEEQIAILKAAAAVATATMYADAGNYKAAEATVASACTSLCDTQAFEEGSELSKSIANELDFLTHSVSSCAAYANSANEVRASRRTYATGRSASGRKSAFDSRRVASTAKAFKDSIQVESNVELLQPDVGAQQCPGLEPDLIVFPKSEQLEQLVKKSVYKTRNKRKL